MATIRRFEEIRAWQEARELAKLTYGVTRKAPFAKDFGLKDQIQRAAVSVGSNIAEGFARSGNKEFSKFLWIARGSAAEVQSQLYTAFDIGYVNNEDFKLIYDKACYCSLLIYRFLNTLRSTSLTGERYKQLPQAPSTPPTP